MGGDAGWPLMATNARMYFLWLQQQSSKGSKTLKERVRGGATSLSSESLSCHGVLEIPSIPVPPDEAATFG